MEEVDEPEDLFVINEVENEDLLKLNYKPKDHKQPQNTKVMQSFVEKEEEMIEHLRLSNLKQNGDSVCVPAHTEQPKGVSLDFIQPKRTSDNMRR